MGAFAIYNDCNTDSTIISNLFIDEYMKDAGEVEIKVYLYLVRMMSAGRSTSISEMSALFGHSEREISRALTAWEKRGLLILNRDSRRRLVSINLCPVEPRVNEEPAEDKSASESERVISIEPVLAQKSNAAEAVKAEPVAETKSSASAAGAASASSPAGAVLGATDEERAQLLFIIEQYIGKPLSPNEMQTIYYMADELHFSNDLIDYLVQYCVERGKKDFRYIEKVAINWKEQGIQTAQDARKASVQTSRARRSTKSSSRSKNAFNEFEQNSYDFEALEKALLQQE